MAVRGGSTRSEAPSFEDLRSASRQLLADLSTTLHGVFDRAVTSARPVRPVAAPVVVRRSEGSIG